VVLPPEPFGMWLDEGPRATVDPCDGQSLDPSYSRLVVTHLLGGEITLINSGAFHPASTDTINPTERVVLDVRASLLPADPTGRRGGFAVAPITPGDPLSFWYATSRLTPQIELFRVAEANLVLPAIAFSLGGGAFQAGDDVRDVVPQPELNRVFMVDNHPPSVFTVDTRLVQSNEFQSGAPANQVTDIITICQGPSHLGLRTFEEPGAPGEPPRTVTRIYVVCFTSGQVAVIDPDLSEVLDQISVGNGANDIAFNFGPGMAEPAHRRAYVATYSDSAIAVIDLDRGSPTEDRVVGRIGVIYRPGQ
jgi:hypothetical protein